MATPLQLDNNNAEEKDQEILPASMQTPDHFTPYEQPLPVRQGLPTCEFYVKAGWCRYGERCRFSHPPEIAEQHRPKSYNTLGFPLRENVGDCPFFMQSRGRCKFASTCKYNHPQYVIDYNLASSSSSPQPSPDFYAYSPAAAAFCGNLYYTGTCPYGDRCVFSHEPSFIGGMPTLVLPFQQQFAPSNQAQSSN